MLERMSARSSFQESYHKQTHCSSSKSRIITCHENRLGLFKVMAPPTTHPRFPSDPSKRKSTNRHRARDLIEDGTRISSNGQHPWHTKRAMWLSSEPDLKSLHPKKRESKKWVNHGNRSCHSRKSCDKWMNHNWSQYWKKISNSTEFQPPDSHDCCIGQINNC
jgi:hypothetical protein